MWIFDSIFEFIFLVGWLTMLIIRIGPARCCKKQPVTLDRRFLIDKMLLALAALTYTIFPLVYLFSPWLDAADYSLPDRWGYLGAALLSLGLLIIYKAHLDLGRNFGIEPVIFQGHQLINNGIYHYIRHPMYAAFMLISISQALLLENWIAGLSAIITFIPLYLVRVRQEEKMMLEHFGDTYLKYMQQTGRICPKLKI